MWGRRALTFPGYTLSFVVLLALSPLLLPLGFLLDLVRRSRFAIVRSLLLIQLYLGCELLGLLGAAWLWLRGGEQFLDGNFRLQWWWASTLFALGRALFGLRVEVEGAEVARPGPILVLIRHASVADTLLPVALVSAPYQVRLRYVLKRELLWDPCLDVVGNRLPNAFVRRGAGDTGGDIAAVEALMDGLGANDGVLIFPEGTRATPRKRERVLAQMAESPQLERARKLAHLLPPRLGGVLALLERNQQADVVFLAHAGFDQVRTLADFWKGKLVGAHIRVRLWRCARAQIPVEPEARISWLYDEWQRMDDWVDALQPRDPDRR